MNEYFSQRNTAGNSVLEQLSLPHDTHAILSDHTHPQGNKTKLGATGALNIFILTGQIFNKCNISEKFNIQQETVPLILKNF